MKLLKKSILVLIISAASALFASAADFRTWTSKQGGSIEAQILKYDNGIVFLTTKEPKEIQIKVADLSLADRQYLIEFAQADKDLLMKGEPDVPEHQWRNPKDFIKKLEETLSLDGSEDGFELYQTKHYLFAASKGVNPQGVAETAEACWHGMAFQHLEFIENWGTTRKLIILPKDTEVYEAVGKYEKARLIDAGQGEAADNSAATWSRVGVGNIGVKEDVMKKHNLKDRGLAFNTKDKKDFRKDWHSFQTHVICSDLLSEQLGGVSRISGNGYFPITRGHSFYKEIQLTKKTMTNLLSKDSGGDIGSKKGFDDGTAWAKELQKLVKKDKIKLQLLQTLNLESPKDLDPVKLVTMYSLSYFMQSTQPRIAAYAKLCRRINTSDQVPAPSELVKFFGYETVDAFEKDWTEFVKSRDFK
jgi:hypothetical protein|tara:strand:- start:2748 stop:3998 length:1251 start_codon:yes stop_codon:yes gene_type:complete